MKRPNPKKTVAILDDSALSLEMTRRALEEGGFFVVTARSVKDLDLLLATSRPDLILVDVNMPEMYGDDVATVLKLVRRLEVPICLFSDRNEGELALRAARAGADGYVSKARGLTGVLGYVRSMLGGAE